MNFSKKLMRHIMNNLSVKEVKFSRLTHIEIELKGIIVVSDKSRDLCT